MPDQLRSAEIEVASAFLVLQSRALQTDEGKETSPVAQGQEGVEVDQEPLGVLSILFL